MILMLVTLVPTVLITALGIVLLAAGTGAVGIVIGILVLVFCTTSVTGYILGSIFVSRGASIARIQNDFLSAVSHELRTPLTSIRMFMETLRDDRLTDPADKEQCFLLLEQEVGRLQGLVERLIELSRIEAGKHNFERKPVFIDDMIADALSAFDAATLSDPTTIEVTVEPGLVVLGDHAALSRVIVNLLINAWKYTARDDRKIALRAESLGDKRLELVVTDNGVGIPEDEQDQIFDKFERGQDAIDGRKSGVGLGLATVRAIIRAHKGRIELHSDGGEGAEFRIVLRRTQPLDEVESPGVASPGGQPAGQLAGEGTRGRAHDKAGESAGERAAV